MFKYTNLILKKKVRFEKLEIFFLLIVLIKLSETPIPFA